MVNAGRNEPWAGVTLNDVAVPDVCVPPAWPAARASVAVRSLFDFDILAIDLPKVNELPFYAKTTVKRTTDLGSWLRPSQP